MSCLIEAYSTLQAPNTVLKPPRESVLGEMKLNVKYESKISAYSLEQGVVISNANQSNDAR